VRRAELGGAPAYVVGEQQLAARRRPEPLHRLERALVGDGERADLLDVVAPELDPQGVLLRRREHVDDAAAHRELAATLHHVDAGVRRLGEAAHDLLQRPGVARRQLDRLDVGKAGHLRLEEAADRRDHHLERAVGGVVPGVPQAAQDGEAAPDGVAAWAEALVRERLPAGVGGDGVGVDEVGELLDEVLGLARGGGDREDRAASLHQAVDHERTHRSRAGQVEGGPHRGVVQRSPEGRCRDEPLGGGEQRGADRSAEGCGGHRIPFESTQNDPKRRAVGGS
jgi:hypothetical protein